MSVVSWCILCVIWQSPEGYQKHLPVFLKPDTGRVKAYPNGINACQLLAVSGFGKLNSKSR
ncbi:MAG: hypothetical protein EOM46_23090 [Gammaproteobacteria bacterium]|nr:hypothetical protein [Gammaproteobacteria bacterium]